jgi:phosphoribulokinase
VRVLGEENVTHVCVDDYHRYDRKQRAERNITPLHPECNYMDIMAQHLAHMRAGDPFLKPVYRHDDGTFGAPVRIEPKQFSVVDGLLGYYTEDLRRLYDVRTRPSSSARSSATPTSSSRSSRAARTRSTSTSSSCSARRSSTPT